MLHPSLRLDALVLAALFSPLLAGCSAGDGRGEGGPLGTAQEASVCPSGATVKGVDVSVYQDTVNWTAVKAAGIDFAIARISDGSDLDTQFGANWPGMKSAGLVRGAYQFFEPGEDPTTQANIVISAVGVLGDGDLPVTADMEITGGQSGATIAAHLQTWVNAVQAGTGKAPMVYTAEGYWDSDVGSSAFGDLPLWVANWDVTCPTLATGWSSWKVWQYADNGTVSGIPDTVDLDEFNGDLTALQTFAGGAPAYGAAYVSQSWPLATTTMQMTVNQALPASITLKNTGTKSWDSKTHLGTTEPEDRTSPFTGPDWLSANRLAGLPAGMTVAPGGTFKFQFDFQAPSTPGLYTEYYGMVEDGVTWFSAAGQGGPPDNDIEAKIQVNAVQTGASSSTSSSSSSSGGGMGGAGGAGGSGGGSVGVGGASGPSGSSSSSGETGSTGGTSATGGASSSGEIHAQASCSYEAAGDESGASAAWLAAAGALVLVGRRRRR
jgi:lysozyme